MSPHFLYLSGGVCDSFESAPVVCVYMQMTVVVFVLYDE